ncbi:MAG TPA: PAS domain-containing protein, partial [Flavisolibacter sp.]|nr:PAS domain-containing protein [Flavisolibacter sp.]
MFSYSNQALADVSIEEPDLYLFEHIPGNNVLVKVNPPHFTILAVTPNYLKETGKTRNELIGKGFFEAFPKNPNDHTDKGEDDLRASFNEVITKKQEHKLPTQRYDVANTEDSFEERYWNASNIPLFDSKGNIAYIIHTAVEITHLVKAEQQAENLRLLQQADNLFRQAPIAIAVLTGDNFTIELANDPVMEIWGKGKDIIGKSILQVLPEIGPQGFIKIMQDVVETGISFHAYEMPATLLRNGKEELIYFNFVYQPYYRKDQEKPGGIIIFATEVTDRVNNKKKLEDKEQSLELAIEIGELGVYKINLSESDILQSTTIYSAKPLEWFGISGNNARLIDILNSVHPEDKLLVTETLQRSIAGENNGRHDFVYRVNQQPGGAVKYIRSIGHLMQSVDGEKYISGILQDITEQINRQQKIEESEITFRNMVMRAPVAIAVFRGDNLVAEIANDAYLPLVGKKRDEFIGKPLFESLPETKELLEPLARHLMQTGETFPAVEFKIDINRNGKTETCYFNSVWEPTYNRNGKVDGFMVVAHEVTGQVIARQKVEESEQRVRSLVESAPFPIGVYVGKEMQIVLANQAIINIYGKGPDVIGKSYKEILPELDNQEIFNQLDQVMETGIPFHAKNQRVDIEHAGQLQTYYFNYSFTPLFDADEKVYGIMNTAADVTDLVLAKKVAEISEEKARLAIASAELGTYEVDLATDETLTSGRFQEIWGVNNTTDRSKFEAVIHPEDLPIRNAAMKEGLESSHLDYEARLSTSSGAYKWVKASGRFLYNEDGKADRLLGVIQDISKQKIFAGELEKQVKERTEELERSKQVLLESYNYLQTIINKFDTALTSLLPVYKDDEIIDFRFKMSNEAYSAYSQLSPSKIQGKLVSDVFPEYKKTDAFARYVETYQTGIDNRWQLHYDVDGLDIYLQVTASKTGDEVLVHFTDFTKLKNLQLELERKVTELERSNRNLEEFAHAASHDLKEPIRKIHFFTEQLKDQLGTKINESQMMSFNRIENASKRMGNLIDDLLMYSHVSQRPHETEPINLTKKINWVLEDLELDISEKSAVINIGDLPIV